MPIDMSGEEAPAGLAPTGDPDGAWRADRLDADVVREKNPKRISFELGLAIDSAGLGLTCARSALEVSRRIR